METFNTSICRITGLATKNFKETDSEFEYSITYKNRDYRIKFFKNSDIHENYYIPLKSLLLREEWPFDQDYHLTKHLVELAFRYLSYPNINEFDKKVIAYLEWIYKNGGNVNHRFRFNKSDYWQARAFSEDEFIRVFERLEQKEYITILPNDEFKLSKTGISTVEEIHKQKPEKLLDKYKKVQKPMISIINVEEDRVIANKLYQYFSNKGFPYTSYPDVEDDGFLSHHRVDTISNDFKGVSEERPVRYWVFIKSNFSDKNNSFGSIFSVASQAHIDIGKGTNQNMISIAKTTDSNDLSWPRYFNYRNNFFDIRLEPAKEDLVELVLEDWVEKQNQKFKTKEELLSWLTEQSKLLNTSELLLRPLYFKEKITNEQQLFDYLNKLSEERVLRFTTLPGCGGDQYEYNVKILTEDDRNAAAEEHIGNHRDSDAMSCLERVFDNFHRVAVKLRERREGRTPIIMNDEYDVQDLLNSLLQLYFTDIRREDYNPSNAGSNTKLDFVLKNENIIIEAKMSSDKLKDKELSNQLLLDIARYESHPNCKTLVAFIYDKGDFIINKGGLINDLERKSTDRLKVKVYIVPTK